MDGAALADGTWHYQMRATGEARTQAFARKLIGSCYRSLQVRSFAPGANVTDLNLVLWASRDAAPSRLTLIDDENHLQQT